MITVYTVEKKRKTLIGQYAGNRKNLKVSDIVRALELAAQDCSEEELSMGRLIIDGVELAPMLRKYLQTKGINA